jgi:hypothetical protein
MGEVKKSKIKHVIYTSRPTFFDNDVLDGILHTSRANNIKCEVTGSLVFHSDLYLQLLEGPTEAIDKLYQKILEDSRHVEITKLRDDNSDRRLFASWTMKSDVFQSWMLSRGALNKLTSDDALQVFDRLARETDQFVDTL